MIILFYFNLSFSALSLLVGLLQAVKIIAIMTYYVLGGTLNPTHSLTHFIYFSTGFNFKDFTFV